MTTIFLSFKCRCQCGRHNGVCLLLYVEPLAKGANGHEGAAMIAVGNAELVSFDIVEGILLKLLPQIAGFTERHRKRPARFGVAGDRRIAGDPQVPQAAFD